MIKKLRKRVFLIIMISLSVVTIGTVILFSSLDYTNTINTATTMLDKLSGGGPRKNQRGERQEEYAENMPMNLENSIEGIYSVLIENSKVAKPQNNVETLSSEMEEVALKISNLNKDSGVFDKYIYRIKKMGENSKIVVFMENERTIVHIKNTFLISIFIIILSLIAIYIIAKRISITTVKPVEEAFDKQKQFISDASHELKTPLAVIEANTDVLENEVGKNKWLNYIQNETESMNKLVNELLLLAKIENADSIKEYKQFDLSQEVELISSMFESMAYESNVKIINNVQKDIIFNGSKEDIEHILSTLIDNAIKHAKKESEIKVELSKEKGEISIQVKNVGEPIPENEKEKIFERFYRVDKSRNRNEKRYGLGLAIAKSIVQKYNGKIEVICKDGITNFKVNIG